jgi:hypothetical protein
MQNAADDEKCAESLLVDQFEIQLSADEILDLGVFETQRAEWRGAAPGERQPGANLYWIGGAG